MRLKILLYICFAMTLVASCVKDEDFEDGEIGLLNPGNGPKAVSFPQSTRASVPISVDAVATAQVLENVRLELESKDAAESDVPVTLTLDTAAVTAANLVNFPDGTVSAPLTVTIPAGARSVAVPITIPNASQLDLTKTYGLVFRIASVGNSNYQIASNMSRVIVSVAIKNQFDGVYLMKGYALRLNDPGLTGNFSGVEMPLITAGATSVQFGSLARWGDGISGIGIGEPLLDVDISGSPTFPVDISSAGGAFNAPGYDSRYDPATRTFYISFSWGAGPAARLSIDTLEYLRPR